MVTSQYYIRIKLQSENHSKGMVHANIQILILFPSWTHLAFSLSLWVGKQQHQQRQTFPLIPHIGYTVIFREL